MVSGSLPDIRCGIGDYTARLASELARRPDLAVSVLTSKTSRVRLDAATPAEILPVAEWGLGSLFSLVRTISRSAPHIVHIQYPAVGYGRGLGIVLLSLAVRWFCRVPTVLTIHERRERRSLARLVINFMALSSSLVVTLDPVEASDLKLALGRFAPQALTGKMISTIPVVSNVDRHAWRRGMGASDEDVVVVTFGLIHPRRRVEDIIDAVAQVGRVPIAARLWIVGGEAEYDPETARVYAASLREKAHSSGLDGVVRWMDHADARAVSACLQSSDVSVFLYPDGASGRNTTLQAALDHGLPVVTTDGPATSHSLRDNPRLLLLPAGAYTTSELAIALIQAKQLGSRGGQSPAEASNLQDHVDFHLGAYHRLLQGQRRDRGLGASLESRRP